MALIVPEQLRDATDAELSAILEVMYYVAKSDGVFSDEELALFLRVAATISSSRISAARLALMVHEWVKREKLDLKVRFEELARALPDPDLREMACNLAAQLAEADDAVLVPEQRVLTLLGQTFFPSLKT